ncbi:MAG TPA: beta-ribofuranosylaminobenzene 5'-phosphate synthase family protein [Geminicoccaceae bacterium]|nr:beta-ribofuranosylaminobenzene 5'-phosphate synthase family protein [Geminicoccaceae bacterium]
MVEVAAPARLHLGFLDLHGGLGRRFGSLGVTLDGVLTRLRLEPAAAPSVEGSEAERAGRLLRTLGAAWNAPPVRARIAQAIPPHAGLGSGTQLGLALGVGLARLLGRAADTRAVAAFLERGARSGIGIGAFEQGGVLLDGGRGAEDGPPPIVARLAFPEAWRILLILDPSRRGVHGAGERRAFERLPPFPAELAGELCRLAVMQFLPGVATAELAAAGRAVSRIQALVGDHFAPFQGGRYTSPSVAAVLGWLAAEGVAGLGQSSWGPTGFALLEDADVGERLQAAAERRFAGEGLRFLLVRGRNEGAIIG